MPRPRSSAAAAPGSARAGRPWSYVEPPVEHERVPVGVGEPGLLADARDDRLALELDALRLELGARSVDVRNAEREPCRRGGERLADARRIEDVERHLAAPELHVRLA